MLVMTILIEHRAGSSVESGEMNGRQIVDTLLHNAISVIACVVARSVNEPLRHRRTEDGVAGDKQSAGCNGRRDIRTKKDIIRETELEQHTSEALIGATLVLGNVFSISLQILVQEAARGDLSNVPVEHVENVQLSPFKVIGGVGIVTDPNEVADGVGVDVLELAGHPETGEAVELELMAEDAGFGDEQTVEIRDGQEKSLDVEAELVMHLHQPVQENGAHLRPEVGLLGHPVQTGCWFGALVISALVVLPGHAQLEIGPHQPHVFGHYVPFAIHSPRVQIVLVRWQHEQDVRQNLHRQVIDPLLLRCVPAAAVLVGCGERKPLQVLIRLRYL